ncbi:putative rhamnose oligosaccharide ABC transport system, permease component 2 [Rubellimicrobium mesophilum DSM 19309]|uniref:Putative rhamnose oligosaccharide ABC transport system, permease component 2 n=1 Tax=Rubellimicrobium mesophilum DSM 19309 TaxID=442562 RepID=A0A017HMN0_9RHOB|nr:hypothetical protein [Rubellimicrobium mesophilum]EYD75428.1 putative rhamnose oligosaccharide ABC transport system, permease component 2 [Rubellimicrobium mesophilum DSM 19309]
MTGALAMLVAFVVFVVPFLFIALQAVKNQRDASRMSFSWPSEWQAWENFKDVIEARNYMLLLAYFNSTVITVGAVALLIVLAAMVGYVLQRRRSRWNAVVMAFVLAGLMIPPAVVPTIWVLQGLGLFKTIHGMILIEVAYGLSFSVLLYRAFIATIPKELDEAAIIDGGQAPAGLLPGDPAASEAGDGDADRRAEHRDLQRLHQPALLPAGEG